MGDLHGVGGVALGHRGEQAGLAGQGDEARARVVVRVVEGQVHRAAGYRLGRDDTVATVIGVERRHAVVGAAWWGRSDAPGVGPAGPLRAADRTVGLGRGWTVGATGSLPALVDVAVDRALQGLDGRRHGITARPSGRSS